MPPSSPGSLACNGVLAGTGIEDVAAPKPFAGCSAGVGGGKLNALVGSAAALPAGRAGGLCTATAGARCGASEAAVCAVEGTADAGVDDAALRAGAGRGCAGAGAVSARRVTVPCSEKSRSCAGPTVSAELVVGAGMVIVGAGASASWASAGAAKPAAKIATAGNVRRNAFILTR